MKQRRSVLVPSEDVRPKTVLHDLLVDWVTRLDALD